MEFCSRLLSWYDRNRRSLPWRGTEDVYQLWVSEVILQQTRIEQGLSYYSRFIQAFPDVYSLAAAPEEKVLRLWQGLGYYSRARNMHEAARDIVSNHNGKFPDNSRDLKKLKGVGDYTAAAIASIMFNEAIPAIDGNVCRVLARVFAVPHALHTTKAARTFKRLAGELIPGNRPGDFNQAMMDFGSLICKPKNPDCFTCMFNGTCQAFLANAVDQYPVRMRTQPVRDRFFTYFFIQLPSCRSNPLFFAQQRMSNDIWKRMFELPLLESEKELTEQEVFAHEGFTSLMPCHAAPVVRALVRLRPHKLSHQRIYSQMFVLQAPGCALEALKRRFLLTDLKRFENMAKPKLIERFMEKLNTLHHAGSRKH